MQRRWRSRCLCIYCEVCIFSGSFQEAGSMLSLYGKNRLHSGMHVWRNGRKGCCRIIVWHWMYNFRNSCPRINRFCLYAITRANSICCYRWLSLICRLPLSPKRKMKRCRMWLRGQRHWRSYYLTERIAAVPFICCGRPQDGSRRRIICWFSRREPEARAV